MSLLDTHFNAQILAQGIQDLAAKEPFPGEANIRDVFAKSRNSVEFTDCDSRKYPQIEAMRAFSSKLCDLRVSPTTWAEFKHGTTSDYIARFNYEDQGTTKNIFRDACMDITKSQLINRHPEFLGISVITVLHLGLDTDRAANQVQEELLALSNVFQIRPELTELPYAASVGANKVNGLLSIYLFGRPNP